ncbi:MAG: hypothetical protein EHM45_24640 [Desulfobacteraceae bacterium]|nr:MAG: hypothetical protein EHM45_24640 [Desulfobacteraceae bacterium]
MSEKSLFTDKVAEKIWAQYFRRLDRWLRALDETQKQELILEIKGHLLESLQSEPSESESERLLNAIERLGEPETYVKPMLAERLLTKASKSLKPKDVLRGLYYHFVGGVKKIFAGIIFVFGYALAVSLALIGLLKVFFPGRVGLFLFEKGTLLFGLSVKPEGARTEVLGYWIIPICLGSAFLLYIGLTKLLKVLKKK